MKYLLTFVLCGLMNFSWSQYKVSFILDSNLPDDSVFLASNINNWDPASPDYRFMNNKLVLENVRGILSFKCTKGSWEKVEIGPDGVDIPNRVLEVISDTTIILQVVGWKDPSRNVEKNHTASQHVSRLQDSIFSPQLGRSKAVYIYLPKDYYLAVQKTYPVLYMHDGQNLFDEYRAAFGEWKVDEFLDSLNTTGMSASIVVAIDNDPARRLNEYNPYDHPDFGKGEGNEYLDYIVTIVKPFIDSHYRTKTNMKYTAIAGSSMGGLISMHAMTAYSHVFGSAGIFSPAFWVAPDVYTAVLKSGFNSHHLLYFYAGDAESKEMVPDMQKMIDIIKEKNYCRLISTVERGGLHNEQFWEKAFPAFYSAWLYYMND
jgi:predicted alpha/beta superfamily hydrolase